MILYYLRSDEDRKRMAGLTASVKETGRCLTPKDLKETIAALSGRKGVAPAKEVSIPPLYNMPECILFDVEKTKLDDCLDACKTVGLAARPLKAVITIHNQNWSLYELLCELKKEADLLN